MDPKVRAALNDIAALNTVMREELDPYPMRNNMGRIMVQALMAEEYLARLYDVGIKVFGNKGPWTNSQYEIAAALDKARGVIKRFIEYYNKFVPPDSVEDRAARSYLDHLYTQMKEEQCDTPSTASRT